MHNRAILLDGNTGLTKGRKLKQHKVSKCQNIDKEILFRNSIAVLPNKMARVVDGGFAYRESEMINPSSPPEAILKC